MKTIPLLVVEGIAHSWWFHPAFQLSQWSCYTPVPNLVDTSFSHWSFPSSPAYIHIYIYTPHKSHKFCKAEKLLTMSERKHQTRKYSHSLSRLSCGCQWPGRGVPGREYNRSSEPQKLLKYQQKSLCCCLWCSFALWSLIPPLLRILCSSFLWIRLPQQPTIKHHRSSSVISQFLSQTQVI